jgi:acyl carrier protein
VNNDIPAHSPTSDKPGATVLTRADVIDILAALDGRPADQVAETVESMELAWLVHGVEQRYGRQVDLTMDQLSGIRTVADAVDVLGMALAEAKSAD